jgi:hypothetical protein
MTYDPVDESVDLDGLVDEHSDELRSYLQASSGTLFSGGTIADDLARRGLVSESDDYDYDYNDDYNDDDDDDHGGKTHRVEHAGVAALAAVPAASSQSRGVAGGVWNGLVAVVQSLLAVVFGAGLFIAFDQLWRWNNLVALVLTVIVVLALAAGVRVVRRTEDIVSTLTAVAVGLLVTLGPLALQST